MSLGLEQGWIAADITKYEGTCSRLGHPQGPFAGGLSPTQVGSGSAPPPLAASVLAQHPWPPAISSVTASTYRLAPTGSIISMPVDSGAPSGATGWANAADTALGYTPSAGVAYPPSWRTTAPVAR